MDLGVTNGTFVTKSEFESNFICTLTEEPKLKHWVNTKLNQLVIQVEPSSRCIQKVTIKFTLFLKTSKEGLKSVILIKHHMEAVKEGIVKNSN